MPRLLITAATLAYGLGPFIIDMNKTHLRHPAWPGHARFHLLWSAIGQALVAGLALWLIWKPSDEALENNRLAGVIGLCLTAGFWGALVFKKKFHGTLHDPQGIPPLFGKIDGNLVAVILIDALLLIGLGMLL